MVETLAARRPEGEECSQPAYRPTSDIALATTA
jgi:hypothetical protein